MAKLKNSEQMLNFLKDLSNFTQTFNTFQCNGKNEDADKSNTPPKEDKEKPQSPTTGIADDFIQKILDSYLQKHWFLLFPNFYLGIGEILTPIMRQTHTDVIS